MGDSKRDIEQWLDCYDPEIRVFPDLRKRLAKGEGLGKRDVLLIVKWKLGRIKGSNSKTVSDENLKKINTAIVEAAKPEKALAALKALEEVPGIVLATATAILTVCYPDTFTIIDERVLESLDLLPGGHEKKKRRKKKKEGKEKSKYNTEDWTAETYVDEYLPKVKARQDEWKRTLRETDQALWGLSVNRRVEKVIKRSEEESRSRQDELRCADRVEMRFLAQIVTISRHSEHFFKRTFRII